MIRKNIMMRLTLVVAALSLGLCQVYAQSPQRDSSAVIEKMMRRTTPAQRKAAAERFAAGRKSRQSKQPGMLAAVAPTAMAMPMPGGTPDYFGMPNWANSPLPTVDPVSGVISGGI